MSEQDIERYIELKQILSDNAKEMKPSILNTSFQIWNYLSLSISEILIFFLFTGSKKSVYSKPSPLITAGFLGIPSNLTDEWSFRPRMLFSLCWLLLILFGCFSTIKNSFLYSRF